MTNTHIITKNNTDDFILNAFMLFGTRGSMAIVNPDSPDLAAVVRKDYNPLSGLKHKDLEKTVVVPDSLDYMKPILNPADEIDVMQPTKIHGIENIRLVVVNDPTLPFRDVAERYPYALVAGYAHTDKELINLQRGCDIVEPFVFRPMERDNTVYEGLGKLGIPWCNMSAHFISCNNPDYFIGLGVSESSIARRVITRPNHRSIIAEGLRQRVLDTDPESEYPGNNMRDYYKAQQAFLDKAIPDWQGLFFYSPVFDHGRNTYPILRKVGSDKQNRRNLKAFQDAMKKAPIQQYQQAN